MRTCVACHATREQRALLRVVRTVGGEIRVDPSWRLNGRGAYVCADQGCITAATSRGSLARALAAAAVPDSLAADLTAVLGTIHPTTHPDTTFAGGSLGQE